MSRSSRTVSGAFRVDTHRASGSTLHVHVLTDKASWSGLFYLALFLSAKFAVGPPSLPHPSPSYMETDDPILPLTAASDINDPLSEASNPQPNIPQRNRVAAPPVYLLALPLVPIGVAIYITSTRYFQFMHHGFDLIAGSLIGILTAWFSFRFYHSPVLRGAGWAWGARSRDRAWVIGVGRGGYVGREGWSTLRRPGTVQSKTEETVAA
jgi:hypothetical protein